MRFAVTFVTDRSEPKTFVITADSHISGLAIAKSTCTRAGLDLVTIRPATPQQTKTLRDILEYEDVKEHDNHTIDTLIDEALLDRDEIRFNELIEMKKKRRMKRL